MIMQMVSCIEFHESRRRMARSFTRGLALAALSLVSLMLAGCGGGGGGGSDTSATPVVSGFAYVANGNSDNVSAYTINATTGALTPVGSPVAAGDGPNSIVTTRKL